MGGSPLTQRGEVPPDPVRVQPFPSLSTKAPHVLMWQQLDYFRNGAARCAMCSAVHVGQLVHLPRDTNEICINKLLYTTWKEGRHFIKGFPFKRGPGNYCSAVTKSFSDCYLSRHIISWSSHCSTASGQPKMSMLWNCVNGPCRGNKGGKAQHQHLRTKDRCAVRSLRCITLKSQETCQRLCVSNARTCN